MNVFKKSQRLSLAILLVALAALTGCASTRSIDPTRTSMMVAHAVAPPGADGMTTSETKRCVLKGGPISPELAEVYLKDPAQAVKDGVCDFNPQREVVQGSPSLAGQMAISAVNAATAGVATFVVQNALQRQQQEHCKKNGGCGTTIENNNNGSANAGSTSQAVVDGVKVDVRVKLPAPATPATCGGKPCLSPK
jgi:hypothetical protein